MKALVFEHFGEPGEVLQLREIPLPEPGPGQVRVRMLASPINPSDLLVVRGRYGVLPKLPATPGFEGVGIVEKLGPGLNPLGRLVKGKRVCVINSAGGNWAEYAVIPARQARPVARDIPDEQVASFFVNPATAVAMVRHVLRVPRGAWLVQSAAGSELGKMIVRLGRHDGFKTLNLVRRDSMAEGLRGMGADAVVNTERGSISEEIAKHVGTAGAPFAIDPVGGPTGSAIFKSLAEEGRMLVYGSLSETPIEVESRQLIAKRCEIQGFWLGHFMRSLSIPASLSLFREIATLMRANVLTTHVAASFPLADHAQAIRQSEGASREGKVLLRISS
jgi:NADPH:quinone reductase-like Zn-dependent oxidoreductase